MELKKRAVAWPSLYFVGLTGYPDSAYDFEKYRDSWYRLTVADGDISAKYLNDKFVEVTRRIRFADRDDLVYVWEFDLQTLMPVRRQVGLVNFESGKYSVHERASIHWREADGLFVANQLSRSVLQNERDEETGELRPYTQEFDTVITWSRLDEEISAEDFDLDRIRAADDMKQLLE